MLPIAPAVPPKSPPNIVFVLAEDIGPQLSCYGFPQVSTPNLDKFAAEGRRYESAFCAAPICSPSRSSMMLGAHPQRFGALDHRLRDGHGPKKTNPLPLDVPALTEILRSSGYYTALGCGFHDKTDLNFDPRTKLFEGKDWSLRKPGQPFFAQITLGSTHPGSPWGQLLQGSPKISPDSVKLPPHFLDIPQSRKWFADYLSIIQYMDGEFKMIVDRIDAEGLRDNTIVIFIGDNGSSMIRGKEWLYDAGLHVPLLVRWPGNIKPKSVFSGLVSMLDVTAGMAKVGSGSVPKHMDGVSLFDSNLRGRSFIAASRGRSDEMRDSIRCMRTKEYKYIRNFMPQLGYQLSRYALYVHPHLKPMQEAYDQGALNAAQSQYFVSPKPTEELYDIKADPYELTNLASDPDRREQLMDGRKKMTAWLKEIGDPLAAEVTLLS